MTHISEFIHEAHRNLTKGSIMLPGYGPVDPPDQPIPPLWALLLSEEICGADNENVMMVADQIDRNIGDLIRAGLAIAPWMSAALDDPKSCDELKIAADRIVSVYGRFEQFITDRKQQIQQMQFDAEQHHGEMMRENYGF